MKKVFLIVLIFIIVFIIAFFLFLHFKDGGKVSEEIRVDREKSDLSVLEKKVSHFSKETGLLSEVVENRNIWTGDVVETSDTGRATLMSEGGNITVIDYSSKITVEENNSKENREKIFLQNGKSWSRVKKIFGKGEFYEIETQNAVAAVRGTSFGVIYKNMQTFVIVTDGTVLLTPISTTTRSRLEEKSVLLKAGFKALVTESGEIKISAITDTDRKDYWYIYNNKDNLTYKNLLDIQIQINQLASSTQSINSNNNSQPNATSSQGNVLQGSGSLGGGGGGSSQVNTSKISIRLVSPDPAYPGDSINVYGSGLDKLAEFYLGRFLIENASITTKNSGEINFLLPDISEGFYPITVKDTYGNTASYTGITVNPVTPNITNFAPGQ